MAVFRSVYEGREYKWIEKGARAALIVDDTRTLWWGDLTDPVALRKIGAPIAVLLELSILRKAT